MPKIDAQSLNRKFADIELDLDNKILKVTKVDESSRDEIISSLVDENAEQYLRNQLGIVGAALGIVNPHARSFVLVQNPYTKTQLGLPAVERLSYCKHPSNTSDQKMSSQVGNLIDWLFITRRGTQSLEKNPPEFYAFLENNPLYSKYLDLELAQNLKKRRILLYCSREILFFVYLWRWLIHYGISKGDFNALVTLDQGNDYEETKMSSWWDRIKYPEWPEGSPEGIFSKLLFELDTSMKSGGPDPSLIDHKRLAGFGEFFTKPNEELNYYKDLVIGWNFLNNRAEPLGIYNFKREWRNLGLTKGKGVESAYSLRLLIDFSLHIVNKMLTNEKQPEQGIEFNLERFDLDAIRNAYNSGDKLTKRGVQGRFLLQGASNILEATARYIDKQQYNRFGGSSGPIDLEDLFGNTINCLEKAKEGSDREIYERSQIKFSCADAIRTVGLHYLAGVSLGEEHESPTVNNLLWKLHQLARFPVIPYYYLTIWDSKPKQQLIFPVWESKGLDWEFHIPKWLEPKSNDGVKRRTSSAVVICLLTLENGFKIAEKRGWIPEPANTGVETFGTIMKSLDNYWNPDNTELVKDKGINVFNEVKILFQILARPYIDFGFYGIVARNAVEADQWHEFAHRTLSIIEAIQDGLRDQDLVSKMNMDTRSLLTILESTVSRYRRTPHDPSKRFRDAGDTSIITYIDMASEIALRRATRDVDSGVRLFAMNARVNPKGADRILIDQIQLSMPIVPASIEDTIRSESFAVMFVHSLGQALYHTLRCKLISNEIFKPARIDFLIDDETVMINIWNPGTAGKSEHDVRDLMDLANYYLMGGYCIGPEWQPELDGWVTSFTIRRIDKKGRED
jgi:hypothetical protein